MLKVWVLLGLLLGANAGALELAGFLTSNCERQTGLITYVTESSVEFIGLDGRSHTLSQDEIETLYIFNVIENPFEVFHIDEAALARLKAIYVEDSEAPRSLAFPARFIEDLLIFYSIDGKSHVHTYADIHKLRPAPASALGDHRPGSFKRMNFEFTDQSIKCVASSAVSKDLLVKPTRVLANKISISEFLNSFRLGYEAIDSFQERTYLYARPFVFQRRTRLGLVFMGNRDEPGVPAPLYFQWSTGEPYRFQSQTTIGSKNQEFSPNSEPVFALRTDVKSHAFHALFVGNIVGIPAGTSIFLANDYFKPKGELTVQPAFNYLAMMGGDLGPYSLSVGFFYPDYGVKVRNQYREVLGTSASYAVRAMYTVHRLRLRAIGALTDYSSAHATKSDVLVNQEGSYLGNTNPDTYSFHARFLRGGIDFDFSERLRFGVDGILVNGNYKEMLAGQSSDLQFNKFTIQPYLNQSFGNYVSITGFANIVQDNYKSNFNNDGLNKQKSESRFFAQFEFIF